MAVSAVDELNRWCRCVAVDPDRLRGALESRPATAGLYGAIRERQPHLFSPSAVFVSRAQLEAMRAVVAAVEALVDLPGYREQVLAWAPPIARFDPGPRGALLGFDFHVTPDGPRLIEINTNPGGALLNAALSAAELACCREVASLVEKADGTAPACPEPTCGPPGRVDASAAGFGDPTAGAGRIEGALRAMFVEEWRRQRGEQPLERIAIVDDQPTGQYLYPEFLLFQELFAASGIPALIADPRELEHRAGALWARGERIDLVYNRLTDFALAHPPSAALRSGYLAGDAVVTPHPRAHALYADKRNLALLSDPGRLRALGAPEDLVGLLAQSVPATRVVEPGDADRFWRERKRWFFKPVAGYGSKAAYRGDKLTRTTFAAILAGDYVAQEIVAPSERTVERDGESVPLKLDLRNYAYAGEVLLVAARLYQGQTTNFRTPGGGFAPVFSERT